ncbi:TadE/TadG family type IV pilus assembly protein [Arthrobacter wenxiniae]|uniref:Pilus assembly protein n=1 Tax=Arthrobacter wenxiniae TaxID=2713570 RepID=A0A7Y7IIE8_9MICC|nr:pilus assembly protein [Arthrobacter wenxiniae]
MAERGAAVVDFVLVSTVVTVMFLALIQLAVVLHVRNTVADAASSAARYGALADRTAPDAEERARLLIGSALGSGFAQDVAATVSSSNGIPVLTVSVKAPLPLLGLWGPGQTLEMSGHAVIDP